MKAKSTHVAERGCCICVASHWFPFPGSLAPSTERCSEFPDEHMGTLNQTTGLHPVITEAQAPVPRGAAGARAQGSWLPASTRTSRFLSTSLVSAPDGRRVSQLRTVCKATEVGRLQRSFKPETGLVTSLLSCSLGKNGFRQSPLSPTPAPSSAACSLKDPGILWFRVKPARGLRCRIREACPCRCVCPAVQGVSASLSGRPGSLRASA